jgi:hypothetical protein
MSALPALWDESGDVDLMKQLLLALVAHLFEAIKAQGVRFHHLVLPIIREIVTPGSKLGESLLDDGMDLWCTVVRQTPTPSSGDVNRDLVGLLPFVPPILEYKEDTFEKAVEILDAYVLLFPSDALQFEFFTTVLSNLTQKLGQNSTTQSSGFATKAVELAWNAGVAMGGRAGAEELVNQFSKSGFFDTLISGIRESYEAHQTTGPKAIHTKIQGIIETDYFAILSRIAYTDSQLFMNALQASSAVETLPEGVRNPNNLGGFDLVLQWVLDEWFSHFEDVADPSRKKLIAMALTRFLDLPQPVIATTHHMQSLLALWTSVVLELTDGCDDKSVDCLVRTKNDGLTPNGWEGEGPESPDFERLKALQGTDPVFTVNLLEVIRNCLTGFVQRFGGEEAFQRDVLVNVDKDIVDGFVKLGIL